MKKYKSVYREGFKPNFKSAQKFADYLNNTLIPDLEDSGKEATAEDFEQGVDHLEYLIDKGKILNVKGLKNLISFLKGTLIPDLKDFGSKATAKDFEELIYWIEKLR